MTFDDLASLVARRYDRASGGFELHSADFGPDAAAIHTLFATVIQRAVIRLDAATPPVANEDAIAVRGILAGAPPGLTDAPLSATLVLRMVAGDPRLVLITRLAPPPGPKPWTFARYFPSLRGTLFDHVTISCDSPAAFIYSSHAHTNTDTDGGEAIDVVSGLNFHGSLSAGAGPAFDAAQVLLGDLTQARVSGSIQSHSYGPTISLTLDTQASLARWFADRGAPMSLSLDAETSPDGLYYRAGLRAAADINLGGDHSVTVEGMLTNNPTAQFTLAGEFHNVPVPGPAELAQWIGGAGDDLAALLPPALQSANTLWLESMWISLQTRLMRTPQEQVASLGFGLTAATEQGWELVPDLLTLRSITARFGVYRPFTARRKPSLTLLGTIDIPSQQPVLQVEAGVALPGKLVSGRLVQGTRFDLAALLSRLIPSAAITHAPPVVFDELSINIDLSHSPASYQVSAHASTDFTSVDEASTSVSLPVGGATPIRLDEFGLRISNDGPRNATAAVLSATMHIFGAAVDAVYDVNDGFRVNAALPAITLDLPGVLTWIVGSKDSLPSWLPPIRLEGTEVYVARDRASETSLAVALRSRLGGDDAPVLAFKAARDRGVWTYAVGITLSKFADFGFPAWLRLFDDMLHFQELVFVMATGPFDVATFGDASRFQSPSLNAASIRLPASSGSLGAGVYLFARIRIDDAAPGNRAFLLPLLSRLAIREDAECTVQISAGGDDVRVYFAASRVEILRSVIVAGRLGFLRQGMQVGGFFDGTLTTSIAGQTTTFDLTLVLLENGVLFAGAFPGTIAFQGIQLSRLMVLLGIDAEGVPSIGVAAEITSGSFDSSVAIFFDSVDPTQSMLLASITDTTLADVYDAVFGSVAIPDSIRGALRHVAVRGTESYDIEAGTLEHDLDARRHTAVAAALAKTGISMQGGRADLFIVDGDAGRTKARPGARHWYVTDLQGQQHYALTLTGNRMRVALEAQVYCVPSSVRLAGNLGFQPAFMLSAQFELFFVVIRTRMFFEKGRGIRAKFAFAPISIGDFFRLDAPRGASEPEISLQTYTDGAVERHFRTRARVELLHLSSEIDVNIVEQGLSFAMTAKADEALSLRLVGRMSAADAVSAAAVGTLNVPSIDLGELGVLKQPLKVDVDVWLTVTASSAKVRLRGAFQVLGHPVTFDTTVDFPVEGWRPLIDFIVAEMRKVLSLIQYPEWIGWVQRGIMAEFTRPIEIARVMLGHFGIDEATVFSTLISMNMAPLDIAQALVNLTGLNADRLGAIVKAWNPAIDVVSNILKRTYNLSDRDLGAVLKRLGYSGDAVAGYLGPLLGLPPVAVGRLLIEAGFSGSDVAATMRRIFGFDAGQVAGFLKSLGWAGDPVNTALQGAGYAVTEVQKAMNTAFGWFPELFRW